MCVCVCVCVCVFDAAIKVSTRAFRQEQCSGSEGAGVRRVVARLFILNGRVDSRRVFRAQELCESRGGRSGLSVLTSLISVDVKLY